MQLQHRMPTYQRIAQDLLAAIKSGAHPPGGYLPSRAELTAKYQVAGATASQAVDVLVQGGWVEGHKGRGMRVLSRGAVNPAQRYRAQDLLHEIYALNQLTVQWAEAVERDGYLHPAQLAALAPTAFRLQLWADRLFDHHCDTTAAVE